RGAEGAAADTLAPRARLLRVGPLTPLGSNGRFQATTGKANAPPAQQAARTRCTLFCSLLAHSPSDTLYSRELELRCPPRRYRVCILRARHDRGRGRRRKNCVCFRSGAIIL